MKWKSMFLAVVIGIVVQLTIPMWTIFNISILAVGIVLLVLVATEIYLAGKDKEDEIDETESKESMEDDEDDDFEEEIEI